MDLLILRLVGAVGGMNYVRSLNSKPFDLEPSGVAIELSPLDSVRLITHSL